MEYSRDDLRALSQEVIETKRKVLIELFASTFLLLWWLGNLIVPLSFEQITVTFINSAPLFLNMSAWVYWGVIGGRIGFRSPRHYEIGYRDPYERYEISLHEFSMQKVIERKIDLLVAIQFIMMGVLTIFSLFLIRSNIL